MTINTKATKRVLIVDDEPHVLDVLREIVARFQHGHAYEITTARSVADTLVILQRERFDLILLDMVLPGIGDPSLRRQGLDLLKRIRDLGVTAPILMMSGDWDIRREAETLIAGAVGYLHKPFNLRDLDHSVALALGTHCVAPSRHPALVCGGPRRRSLAHTLGALGFRVQPARGFDGGSPGRRRRAIYELHSRRDEVDLCLPVASALGLYTHRRRQH